MQTQQVQPTNKNSLSLELIEAYSEIVGLPQRLIAKFGTPILSQAHMDKCEMEMFVLLSEIVSYDTSFDSDCYDRFDHRACLAKRRKHMVYCEILKQQAEMLATGDAWLDF